MALFAGGGGGLDVLLAVETRMKSGCAPRHLRSHGQTVSPQLRKGHARAGQRAVLASWDLLHPVRPASKIIKDASAVEKGEGGGALGGDMRTVTQAAGRVVGRLHGGFRNTFRGLLTDGIGPGTRQ